MAGGGVSLCPREGSRALPSRSELMSVPGKEDAASSPELQSELDSLFEEELELSDAEGTVSPGALRTDVALPVAPKWDPLIDGATAGKPMGVAESAPRIVDKPMTDEVDTVVPEQGGDGVPLAWADATAAAERVAGDPSAAGAAPTAEQPAAAPPAFVAPTAEQRAAAAATPVTVEEARATLARLGQAAEALKAQPGGAQLRGAAEEALEQAREVLDRFPKGDPSFDILRDELLDAYFALDRQAHGAEGSERAAQVLQPPRPARPAPKKVKRTKAAPRSAPAAAPRRGRTIVLVVVMLLLGGARLAYYLAVESKKDAPAKLVRERPTGRNAEARLEHAGGDQSRAYQQGIPIVTFLRLSLRNDGSLRAAAGAADANSKNIKLTYKWSKNGELITVEHEGLLAQDKQLGPGKYHVEVTASDGALTSAPMTAELEVKGGGEPAAPAPSEPAAPPAAPVPPEPAAGQEKPPDGGVGRNKAAEKSGAGP